MKIGKLFGVSIGSGDPKYLTVRAVEVLQDVDVIFTVISKNSAHSTSEDVVKSVNARAELCQLIFSMSMDAAVRSAQVQDNVRIIVQCLQEGKNCAFATLGDAMTYSTFGYVLEKIQEVLPNIEVEIVPGVTSFATLAAKSHVVLAENQESLHIIPSFKADLAENIVFPENSTTILLKTYRHREALFARLEQEQDVDIVYGEHLGMEQEVVLYDMEEIKKRPDTYLSMMMVKKR